MTPIVPRIALFSTLPLASFSTSDEYRWMAKGFEIHFFNTVVPKEILGNLRLSCIVFYGPKILWNKIYTGSIPTIYVDNISGDYIYDKLIEKVIEDTNPKVSIFTPAHKTFEKFDRCYESVINQSFEDWEWIILDDSIQTSNFNYINSLVKKDPRIKLYKPNKNDSFVGSTKRQAASLCSGDYLVELDHDDELHHLALEYIVSAFKKYPDADFCFSNCAEVFEDGRTLSYNPGFGMHFGTHFYTKYKGRNLIGADVPINASTIRHIVGVPNHFRCWKRDFYFKIARHNNKLPVVDDYELLVRTFLNTKIIHIKDILYIQYMNDGGNNTQEPRRAEIQRLVDRIQKYYDSKIHERVLQLNGWDWLWNDNLQKGETFKMPPRIRNTLSYVY